MGLFSAIQQIADTVNSNTQTVDPSDAEAVRNFRYHWKIVVVAGCFAALGAAFGLFALVVGAGAVKGRAILGAILAPVIYGAGGFVFGMALMCLLAPRSFLTGPVGRPWMELIGTKSVFVARLACALFGLVVTLPLVGAGLLIALDK